MNAVQQFLNYMEAERNLSPNTITSYRTDLIQLQNFLSKNIISAKPEDLRAFLQSLKAQGLSVTTTNRKLSTIKSFYQYLMKQEMIQTNPAAHIDSGKLQRTLPKPIPQHCVMELLEKVDNLRDRVILEVLYGTGIRRFELAKLKVSDINFYEGYIRIQGKGGKERIVPIHPAAIDLIRQLVATQDSIWLFPGYCDKHISTRQINNIVQKWATRAGLEGITPHRFRHSFVSHLYDNGADIKTISDMAGHASLNTTNLYAKISVTRNQKEYMKYHPRAAQS